MELADGVLQPIQGTALRRQLVDRDIYELLENAGLTNREIYYRSKNTQLYTQNGTTHGFGEIAIRLREGGFRVIRNSVTFTTAYVKLEDGETREDLENLTGNLGLWSEPYRVRNTQFATLYTASKAELEEALKSLEI